MVGRIVLPRLCFGAVETRLPGAGVEVGLPPRGAGESGVTLPAFHGRTEFVRRNKGLRGSGRTAHPHVREQVEPYPAPGPVNSGVKTSGIPKLH